MKEKNKSAKKDPEVHLPCVNNFKNGKLKRTWLFNLQGIIRTNSDQ
jgi:hypothetical protein